MGRSERARWLQARTRNAAKQILLIAAVGSVVLVTTLLTFVLLPRQADRAIALSLQALPPLRDTLDLLAVRARAVRQRTVITVQRDALRAARDSTAARSPALEVAEPLRQTEAAELLELTQQIDRAKQTPLVESYRALTATQALRDRRLAQSALDSIERLHAEREAWATLGGPDARYAALTERLTSLGAELVQIAERELADRWLGNAAILAKRDSAVGNSSSDADERSRVDDADSLWVAAERAATEQLRHADSLLVAARAINASILAAQNDLRRRRTAAIPPQAMLVASLVLAMAGGFAVALWREMQRPTIGDAIEIELLTRARVFVYRAEGARRTGAIRRVEALGSQGTRDEVWSLLHVALTPTGDVSRLVQVAAAPPLLAGVAAVRLATIAAYASRATVLVDATATATTLTSVLASAATPAPLSQARNVPWPAVDVVPDWASPRSYLLDREVSVDLMVPTSPSRAHRTEPAAALASLTTQTQPYDLVVLIADTSLAKALPPTADVVLCVRQGETPLAWLSDAVGAAEVQGRRVRAVVLWSGELPLAG